jgi:hypothetical protein
MWLFNPGPHVHAEALLKVAPEKIMPSLILKRASASRTSGEWNDDDFDVLADGVAVGRILKVHAAPI